MQAAVPLACFLSMIRPPGVQYENALLQIAPVDKSKCPFVKDNNDIGFQLFTRHNPTVFQQLVLGDDEKLFASNMDFNDKTVVYFHAWMEQPDDGSGIMVREAYMQRGDTNVIMVDAHHLEAGPWYFTAAQNTWYIGRFAALFVDYLASRGLNLNNTHLIGHSLGAHAAGVAGSALKSGRVSRITGLDPALPLFEGLPLEQRLDTTDAHFVDIIHTDAGIFGYKAPMGHADFYPNGGISPQPGCELEVVLPKQLLLNKCENPVHTQGFYSYYLTANTGPKRKSLEAKFENLFAYIQSVKSKNGKNDVKKKSDGNADGKLLQDVNNNNMTNEETNMTSKLNVNKTTENFTNENKTLEVNVQEKSKNSIKDILKEDKIEEYAEDQIADASELDITQVEYTHDKLKNKETISIINDSEEVMLDDTLIKNKSYTNEENTSVINIDNVQDRDKIEKEELKTTQKENTAFTVFDQDFESEENEFNTEDLENKHTDKRGSKITYLNYKDPCEPKKEIKHTTEEINTAEVTQNTVKKEKPKKSTTGTPNEINIFNILGTTYRISQVFSTFRENKNFIKDKIKKLFTKQTIETTPSFLEMFKKGRPKHVVKRQKRFLQFFKRNDESENSNILFKMLDFLIKNRKNVLPVFTMMREINTLVKSGNGELSHITKEQNNYIGATPPVFPPITYNLELGNENKAVAFVKRLLGMTPKGDRLTVNARK